MEFKRKKEKKCVIEFGNSKRISSNYTLGNAYIKIVSIKEDVGVTVLNNLLLEKQTELYGRHTIW